MKEKEHERRRTRTGDKEQEGIEAGEKPEEEMNRAAFLLAVVALTHYGYPFIGFVYDDPEKWASWWFYVLRGAEGTALFYLLSIIPDQPRLWSMACWIGMLEESQTAVCGVVAMPEQPVALWSGLCLERFGMAPYFIAAAAGIIYLCFGDNHVRKT